jgi:3-methylcrotonyl-CoA carboxylase alpha subunit
MFKKVLIANRGEIACRVMRTAKRLGIRTVAVYSDADAGAMHVSLADEAYHIGPPPAAQSYLNIDKIIEVGKLSGAEAVHPGYGFLSENPAFVEAVEKAGMVFMGPPASAMRAMGLKDAAKALMEKSSVPVVPGYHGSNQDADFLASEAKRIGYPVLIKARAGGGGKGMRRVDKPEDFKAALEGAKREAKASFGDDQCLVEKYMLKPRHIEIQVFGDNHGNVVYLFERDCSLQRRHQKVIEEAPAPGMTPEMRKMMGDVAVRAAKAIGYSGAGTVEFVTDASQGLRPDAFYFMEMNTRLQVEHPITECISGQDLVEWQFRVASGEKLPMTQDQLSINGWAFEARIYSEDAAKGFLPATGTLQYLSLPSDEARVDSGVRQGDEITPFYDPMIAKLIVHAPTRTAALNKLAKALERCHIIGTVTNVPFLLALTGNESFAKGDVDTGLIARDLDSLIKQIEPPRQVIAIAAIAALGIARPRTDVDPWGSLVGWRHWTDSRQFALLEWNDKQLDVRVIGKGHNAYEVLDAQGPLALEILQSGNEAMRLNIAGRITSAKLIEHGNALTIHLDGQSYTFGLPDRLADHEESDESGGDKLISPMPGLVKVVSTKAGAKVTKGEPLIVVEAMKMEHTLTAPRDGTVAELFVAAGDHVENGANLLALEAENA